MSYQKALIGQIDIDGTNIGELVLGRDSTLKELEEQYGMIGRGLHIVVSNPIVQNILEDNGTDSIRITPNSVSGLDRLPESEQGLVAELIRRQYDRSERIFEAAKRAELEELLHLIG